MKKYFLLTIILIFSANVKAQNLSNLEIFYGLVDSAVMEIFENPVNENTSVFFSSFEKFPVLYGKAASSQNFTGRKTESNFNEAGNIILFNINDAEVKYSKPFRKGFFGKFFIKRDLTLTGNFILKQNGIIEKSGNFEKIYGDEVKLSDVPELENRALPFTQSEIPAEPFLSNLWEPALALGTAAITVFLFFTVRSK